MEGLALQRGRHAAVEAGPGVIVVGLDIGAELLDHENAASTTAAAKGEVEDVLHVVEDASIGGAEGAEVGMGGTEPLFCHEDFGVIVFVFFEAGGNLLADVWRTRFWKISCFAEEVTVEVKGRKVGGRGHIRCPGVP